MKIENWILQDLKKSGLTLDTFQISPLENEQQLQDRLGFTAIPNERGELVKIIDGYWIPYPNMGGYYRLKLREKINDVKYLSPRKSGNHAYILPTVEATLKKYNPDKPLFFTEGEKKAAKATLESFPTIGLSGVWNFKDSDNEFLAELDKFVWKNRIVFIVFDSDIIQKFNVRQAELRLAIQLINRGAHVYSIRLPNKNEKIGLDDFLVARGAAAFRELISEAKSTLELHIQQNTHTNLILQEIVRLNDQIEKKKVLKLIASREKVAVSDVESEFNKYTEKNNENKRENLSAETFTENELEQAKALLKSENILNEVVKITEKAGYVGEEINKKMLYLSFTSRLLENSISCVIKGASASGKSSLVASILALFPRDSALSYSFITSKALAHFENDLSHKILIVAERSGAEAADYSIRTAISENELSILMPVKDEISGNFKTIEKRIAARGLVYVETTTRERIHNENQTRVFDLYMDESQEQTERILQAEAKSQDKLSNEIQEKLKIFRAAQTLLEPLDVEIPYASALVDAFPKDKPRVRRDFKRFLSLIRAHALLYQYERSRNANGQIIATLNDLKAIIPLADIVLIQSYKELSPTAEAVLKVIQNNFKINEEFNFKQIEEKSPIKDRTLRNYLKKLIKLDFLAHNQKQARESRYMLISTLSLFSLNPFFSAKLSKILKNFEENSDFPQNSSNSSKIKIKEFEENSGKTGFSSKKFNDNNDLPQKNSIEEMRKAGESVNGEEEMKQKSIERVIFDRGQMIKVEYDYPTRMLIVEQGGRKQMLFDDDEFFNAVKRFLPEHADEIIAETLEALEKEKKQAEALQR